MLKGRTVFKRMNEWGAQRIPFLFVIDFLKEKGEIIPLDKLNDKIRYSLHSENKSLNSKMDFSLYPIDYECYKKKFDEIYKSLATQEISLVNLTGETPIEINLTLEEIFEYSTAPYKLYWKNKFVCFSPETFVKIEEGRIFSFPMKGTIDADIPEAEEIILTNKKELEEHKDAVNLIIEDLDKVSENVKIARFRYTDKIRAGGRDLIQVSSEVEGELNYDYFSELGNIFEKLLPAGSICGWPKEKSIEIIRDIEEYERGFYTGVFGVFDGEKLDSGVMIRFIELTDEGLVYKSGGGITLNSDAKKEYEEMKTKVYVPVY